MNFPRSRAIAAIAATGLMLAACSSTTTPPSTSMPPPLDCGASALSGKAGGVVTGSTAQDVRIDGQPITSTGSVRVIAPGMAVTQDYRADRLNLEISTARTLVRAFCG